MATTCSCSTARVAPVASVARPQALRSFTGLRAAAPVRAVRAVPVAAGRASATVTAASAAPEQKIRIKLKAYHHELLEDAVGQIKEAVFSSGASLAGPVPLPTRKRVYCVLKSPHVNKTAREHFEIRTHSRLLDIKNITAQTVDALLLLDLPAGVDVQVKL